MLFAYHFVDGSTMYEAVPADMAKQGKEAIMAGLVAVISGSSPVVRGPAAMIVVNDRDHGNRPNLVMVSNIVRIELIDAPDSEDLVKVGEDALRAAGFQVRQKV